MALWDTLVNEFTKTFIKDNRYELFLKGLKNTLIIAFFAALIGIVIGLIVASLKVYTYQTGKLKLLDKFLSLYITVIRGTPVVVQLLIAYFLIFASVDNALPVAILAFGINSGAYVAEIIRAGIIAVDPGQMEAGRSLGLSRMSTMWHIILPQAFKNILPALGNEFIAVLKETSVAGYIAVVDITKAGALIRGATYSAFFPLITVAIFYLLLVIGMSAILKKVERRLAKSDRN